MTLEYGHESECAGDFIEIADDFLKYQTEIFDRVGMGKLRLN